MDMTEETVAGIPRLKYLAEFRYQMRKFLSFSEAASERCGIAAQQYQLMQVVGALPPGEKASISHIAERMILRHNSTVELVDRAERAGLVRRETDEADLRRSLVQLTFEGKRILERLVDDHVKELEMHGHELVAALEALQISGRDHAPKEHGRD